jgi:hypothetical protein
MRAVGRSHEGFVSNNAACTRDVILSAPAFSFPALRFAVPTAPRTNLRMNHTAPLDEPSRIQPMIKESAP